MLKLSESMKLFRKKIACRDFTVDNGAMTTTRNALRRDKCMNQSTVFLRNLPKDVKPFPQMLLIFFCNHEFPFEKFDFTQMYDLVCTGDKQIYLRAFCRKLPRGYLARNLTPRGNLGLHT